MLTIRAFLRHPQASPEYQELYCFDSEEHGLIAEPFVTSATNAIHMALRWHLGFDHFNLPGGYCRSAAVQLVFTDKEEEADTLAEQDEVILELNLSRPDSGGHLYDWEVAHPNAAMEQQDWEAPIFYEQAWLCPVLLQYFPAGAPERFWVQIKEIEPPVQNGTSIAAAAS